MITYFSDIARKVLRSAAYLVPVIALSCGDKTGYSPNFDPECLTVAHNTAVSESLKDVTATSDFCTKYARNVRVDLQNCLKERNKLPYDCRLTNGNVFVSEQDFAMACVEDVKAGKDFSSDLEFACAEYHFFPSK